jgi:hypothetical protein
MCRIYYKTKSKHSQDAFLVHDFFIVWHSDFHNHALINSARRNNFCILFFAHTIISKCFVNIIETPNNVVTVDEQM